MTAPAADGDLPPELAAAEIAGSAAFGYESPGGKLLVLPCGVTALCAAAQRRPGSARSGAAGSVPWVSWPATVRRNARAGKRRVVP